MKHFTLFLLVIYTTISCEFDKSYDKSGDSLIISEDSVLKLPASKVWLGKWERREWQNDASLEVKGVSNDSIIFSLLASSGGHTGEMEGMAVVAGNMALFMDREDSNACVIQFTLVGDSVITLNQTKGACFAGMGVYYSGTYKNPERTVEETTAASLLSAGVFNTKEKDEAFRKLVGDSYDLFLNSTQLIAEDEDLDSLNTTVRSSGVRGLFTSMENVIMIDADNNIWAAVIDDGRVLYFTNSQKYKNKLPKTIDNWRQSFREYPVTYK